MKLLRLNKITPIRNPEFKLMSWEKAGEVRIYPGNVEIVVTVPPMQDKTEVTLSSGAHFFVEETPEAIDKLINEATC